MVFLELWRDFELQREIQASSSVGPGKSNLPFEFRGMGGASLPLLGPRMLRCLFRALAGACFQPGSPLPSGCSGSGCVTPETDSYVHGLGVG